MRNISGQLFSGAGVLAYRHAVVPSSPNGDDSFPRTGFRAFLNGRGIDGFVRAVQKTGWEHLGFGYARNAMSLPPEGSRYQGWDIILLLVPYWFLLLLFALAPARWVLLSRRDRMRRSQNRCVNCGYDLRATPNRCPECGKAAPAVAGESTANEHR